MKYYHLKKLLETPNNPDYYKLLSEYSKPILKAIEHKSQYAVAKDLNMVQPKLSIVKEMLKVTEDIQLDIGFIYLIVFEDSYKLAYTTTLKESLIEVSRNEDGSVKPVISIQAHSTSEDIAAQVIRIFSTPLNIAVERNTISTNTYNLLSMLDIG